MKAFLFSAVHVPARIDPLAVAQDKDFGAVPGLIEFLTADLNFDPNFCANVILSLKRMTKQRKPDQGEKHVQRVRKICHALPGTIEKISHGEPTFFAGKVFAMCSINHHNDGRIAIVIPAAIGIQEMLIQRSPEKFYRPPYVGGSGWVGIVLPHVSDKELAFHIHEAWRLIAPKKLQDEFDAIPAPSERKVGKRA